MMILLELLVLLVLIAFAANGFKAGAVEGFGRLVGGVLGFLAARAWSGWFITALSLFMPIMWASLVAFIVVFLLVDNIVGFVFKLIEKIVGVIEKLPLIKQISEFLGAIFGLLEGIVVIGGIAFLLRQVAEPLGVAQTVINLKLVVWIEIVFKALLSFLL